MNSWAGDKCVYFHSPGQHCALWTVSTLSSLAALQLDGGVLGAHSDPVTFQAERVIFPCGRFAVRGGPDPQETLPG